ncbi:MAG: glycosyltransferase family 4 protein [Actinomycetota bacterium]|nr:glycosyltransferase family 4 protein [Actinomycetota bacterium]
MAPDRDTVRGATVRVATVPGRHPYVDRCLAGADGIVHAPDPVGNVSYGDPWRPSPALEPSWVHAHSEEVDVVHLHFGFEHRSPDQLREWTRALAVARVPLVVTVHDLDNPHLRDQHLHHESLGILTGAAAEVITLTDGAAKEVGSRYGVTPHVISHPHQFDLDLVGSRHRARCAEHPLIGLNLRSPRQNVDAEGGLDVLSGLPPTWSAVVRVSSHQQIPPRVAAGARDGRWEVQVVPGWCDERDLWKFVSGLDALLLPYRWGTHSGWVESCWDVGTDVVAPPVGYYGDQHPVIMLPLDADSETVHCTLHDITATTVVPEAELATRREQRHVEQLDVAATHAQLYRAVLR